MSELKNLDDTNKVIEKVHSLPKLELPDNKYTAYSSDDSQVSPAVDNIELNMQAKTPQHELLDDSLSLSITQMHVKTLLVAIKDTLAGRRLSKTNVINVMYSLLSLTETMRDNNGTPLKGVVKRQVLLHALKKYIMSDDSMPPEEKGLLIMLVDTLVKQAVDVAVSALKTNNTAIKSCCVIV